MTNTEPTSLLSQLQAAWGVTALVSEPADDHSFTVSLAEPKRIGKVLLTGNTAPCSQHLPPFETIDEPDFQRSGMIRSKCRDCGRFLGYRLRRSTDEPIFDNDRRPHQRSATKLHNY